MANTFSTDIDVLGLHRVVVQGTVDDPGNVASVEIFRDEIDVGSAQVSASGNWRLTVKPANSSGAGLFSAVVTDGTDSQEILNSGFVLSLKFLSAVGRLAQLILSTDPIQLNVFSPDGNLVLDATQADINNRTLVEETGHGISVPFFVLNADQVDAAGTLLSDISNFHITKQSHDFLDFSNTAFSTIAQVLRHTSTFHGDATIHLDQNSTVKVEGVTKAQLAQHRDVFFFG